MSVFDCNFGVRRFWRDFRDFLEIPVFEQKKLAFGVLCPQDVGASELMLQFRGILPMVQARAHITLEFEMVNCR